MKSNTIQKFMRKTFLFGLVVAVSIIAFDAHLLALSPVRVSISTVSAQQLPSFVGTTTLVAAAESFWQLEEMASSTANEEQLVQRSAQAATDTRFSQPRKVFPAAEIPVRLIIPTIGLDTAIDQMGVNNKGEMDVPPGTSPNVGWYKGGPMPGQMGSAVIDAHVFAAFENLRYVKVGEDVIVVTRTGQRLRFVVEESTVFRLGDLTPSMLFGRNNARWLNLITCAGSPVGDTYSHRLVVYTKFVEIL